MLALAASPDHAELRPIVSGLPVAGVLGHAVRAVPRPGQRRRGGERGAGQDGHLTGVNALAGLVVDADGRLLAFSVIADATGGQNRLATEAALDRVAAAIAGCGCS